eukprot:gene19018-25610_t
MKQRIQRFLSATIQANEFSHTVIHGKPKPGELVVAAKGGPQTRPLPSAPPPPKASPPAQPPREHGPLLQFPPLQSRLPSPSTSHTSCAHNITNRMPTVYQPVSAAIPSPSKPSPVPKHKPAAAAQPVRASAASPSPRRPAKPSSAGSRPSSGASPYGARRPASPAPRSEKEVAAAAAARYKDKKLAEAEAAAKAKKDPAGVQRGREMAAIQASRELIPAVEGQTTGGFTLGGPTKEKRGPPTEGGQSPGGPEPRGAGAEGEANRARSVKDEKERRIEDAKRKKAEEEAAAKDAARRGKEKEREDQRAQMAAQKKEYYERQQAAQKIKADAAGAGAGAALWGGMAAAQVKHSPSQKQRAANNQQAAQRPDWSPIKAPERAVSAEAGVVGGRGGAANGLTPEQRRAVWEEQKAAAERNKRHGGEENGRGGGLAAFVGVQESGQAHPHRQVPRKSGDGTDAPTPEQRRQAYVEQQRAAEANKRAHERDGLMSPRPAVSRERVHPNENPMQRKQRKLEEERVQRERELLEFQKRHWKEMQAAAENNRRQIMAEVASKSPTDRSGPRSPGESHPHPYEGLNSPTSQPVLTAPPPPPPSPLQQQSLDQSVHDFTMEYAAMMKDMVDVLGDKGHENDDDVDIDEDALFGDEKMDRVLDGNFQMNGRTVVLPVGSDATLAAKVEALREHLEEKLGIDQFLHVYRRLESLSMDDDEGEVSKEFLRVLGADKLEYLQLVHQLIVTEEQMA